VCVRTAISQVVSGLFVDHVTNYASSIMPNCYYI
jgi:hypothetical protein